MNALALLLLCAADPPAPPPQSTLPLHFPCEVRPPEAPAAPARKPKAAVSEEDTPAGVTPKGMKDDRQLAKGTGIPELDNLIREARKRNAVVAQRFNEDGRGIVWIQATPDGWLTRIKDPTVPRPGVAAETAFRPARNAPNLYECEYSPDHVCHRCGQLQLVIDHWNRDGTHTHRCANCGHTWRH